jgi:mono/diheme cytochrome c family protein
MLTTTEVLPREEFDAWLLSQREAQSAGESTLGEEQWEGVCVKCHGAQGEGGIGPRVAGSPFLADRDALENLVRNGRGRMPAVGSQWSDEQIDALHAYLQENPPSGQ